MTHVEKWEADWKTILINNYHPQSCKNGNCPYVDQCRCKNMCEKLERKITVRTIGKICFHEQ